MPGRAQVGAEPQQQHVARRLVLLELEVRDAARRRQRKPRRRRCPKVVDANGSSERELVYTKSIRAEAAGRPRRCAAAGLLLQLRRIVRSIAGSQSMWQKILSWRR